MRPGWLAATMLVAAACAGSGTAPSIVETTSTTHHVATTAPASPSTTVPHETTTTVESAEDVDVELTITAEQGQTMRGWGFGISLEDEGVEPLVSGEMSAAAYRQALDLLVGDARTTIVRIFSPGFGSTPMIEPDNDNADPADLDFDRFEPAFTGRFRLMRDLDPRGVSFLLTGGAAPSWMKDGRLLRPGMAGEFAEYLTAYALSARRLAGVDFDWVTVANEPDNDAMRFLVDPETGADVLAALAEFIPANGLPARLVVGDTIGWGGADRYLEAVQDDPEVVEMLDAVAAHSYQTLEMRPEVVRRAAEVGIEVWMTEQSAAGGKDCLGDDPGMGSALQWAGWIIDDLIDGRASVWLALRGVASLCHDPQGGLLVYDTAKDRLTVPKRFYAFSQFAQAGPPGSKVLVVERMGEHAAIPAVAFDRGADVALVVVNADPAARLLEVDAPEFSSVVEARLTSATAELAALDPPLVVGGRVRFVLPSESILTLVFTR